MRPFGWLLRAIFSAFFLVFRNFFWARNGRKITQVVELQRFKKIKKNRRCGVQFSVCVV